MGEPGNAERRILQVRVKPRARNSLLELQADGTWRAELKAPPVDGAANAELIRLVAEHFDVARSRVSIQGGASGRSKWVRID